MDTLTLKERAAGIFQTANRLADELALTGHPEPTFAQGLPSHLHGHAPESAARNLKDQLVRMVDELNALLSEPAELLVPEIVTYLNQSRDQGASLMTWYTAPPNVKHPPYRPSRNRRELPRAGDLGR